MYEYYLVLNQEKTYYVRTTSGVAMLTDDEQGGGASPPKTHLGLQKRSKDVQEVSSGSSSGASPSHPKFRGLWTYFSPSNAVYGQIEGTQQNLAPLGRGYSPISHVPFNSFYIGPAYAVGEPRYSTALTSNVPVQTYDSIGKSSNICKMFENDHSDPLVQEHQESLVFPIYDYPCLYYRKPSDSIPEDSPIKPINILDYCLGIYKESRFKFTVHLLSKYNPNTYYIDFFKKLPGSIVFKKYLEEILSENKSFDKSKVLDLSESDRQQQRNSLEQTIVSLISILSFYFLLIEIKRKEKSEEYYKQEVYSLINNKSRIFDIKEVNNIIEENKLELKIDLKAFGVNSLSQSGIPLLFYKNKENKKTSTYFEDEILAYLYEYTRDESKSSLLNKIDKDNKRHIEVCQQLYPFLSFILDVMMKSFEKDKHLIIKTLGDETSVFVLLTKINEHHKGIQAYLNEFSNQIKYSCSDLLDNEEQCKTELKKIREKKDEKKKKNESTLPDNQPENAVQIDDTVLLKDPISSFGTAKFKLEAQLHKFNNSLERLLRHLPETDDNEAFSAYLKEYLDKIIDDYKSGIDYGGNKVDISEKLYQEQFRKCVKKISDVKDTVLTMIDDGNEYYEIIKDIFEDVQEKSLLTSMGVEKQPGSNMVMINPDPFRALAQSLSKKSLDSILKLPLSNIFPETMRLLHSETFSGKSTKPPSVMYIPKKNMMYIQEQLKLLADRPRELSPLSAQASAFPPLSTSLHSRKIVEIVDDNEDSEDDLSTASSAGIEVARERAAGHDAFSAVTSPLPDPTEAARAAEEQFDALSQGSSTGASSPPSLPLPPPPPPSSSTVSAGEIAAQQSSSSNDSSSTEGEKAASSPLEAGQSQGASPAVEASLTPPSSSSSSARSTEPKRLAQIETGQIFNYASDVRELVKEKIMKLDGSLTYGEHRFEKEKCTNNNSFCIMVKGGGKARKKKDQTALLVFKFTPIEKKKIMDNEEINKLLSEYNFSSVNNYIQSEMLSYQLR